eukprot:CAMPEP_0118942508 /NCGR_PEP_ID=MMETSP1169-20130426/36316_1 /TAXON_ID=36882 /ORGANISM="Pyramimonas obovata, Strain CCMP722" /LENGTH=152 /DNA_ID=CAMNT_0006887533 /DNA_START=157 /DNA_END=611 /DNA_ORIENTATION=-
MRLSTHAAKLDQGFHLSSKACYLFLERRGEVLRVAKGVQLRAGARPALVVRDEQEHAQQQRLLLLRLIEPLRVALLPAQGQRSVVGVVQVQRPVQRPLHLARQLQPPQGLHHLQAGVRGLGGARAVRGVRVQHRHGGPRARGDDAVQLALHP